MQLLSFLGKFVCLQSFQCVS